MIDPFLFASEDSTLGTSLFYSELTALIPHPNGKKEKKQLPVLLGFGQQVFPPWLLFWHLLPVLTSPCTLWPLCCPRLLPLGRQRQGVRELAPTPLVLGLVSMLPGCLAFSGRAVPSTPEPMSPRAGRRRCREQSNWRALRALMGSDVDPWN